MNALEHVRQGSQMHSSAYFPIQILYPKYFFFLIIALFLNKTTYLATNANLLQMSVNLPF